ncbi:CDP-glucose 4,6-dehydratase [Aminipila terrae]|uniref:CDP-glucose 4,6-dehydratase n=1 Tax=Aminipila terrae TaxID=2697030 RepID=A0A6P1MJZ2_9FIRM|nr:CDP-glucose 4,6-dehydratase [Aminipila terrae]QHI71956.1 CDP-glucose 4,6-dehydratase [Aminipila terrae]
MKNFYNNKKIFITGNTGFKGTWLSHILMLYGAQLCGYSDKKGTLFEMCGADIQYETIYGDIRNYELLNQSINRFKPDIVIHMAAQPLVIEGYNKPRETYEVNVMGTVNLMTSIQRSVNLGSVVNVTTDKVYKNLDKDRPYSEEDQLGGADPYSCSKTCSELVTESLRKSFKYDCNIATARAGNVIAGGDFAKNRIIPDCINAAEAGEKIFIRNPKSIRPWQHVLDPLNGYITLAKALYENKTTESAFNFGPELEDCISVAQLADLFCTAWGHSIKWEHIGDGSDTKSFATFAESKMLTLDSTKSKKVLNWNHKWNVWQAVEKTVEWHQDYNSKKSSTHDICIKQIIQYNQ